MSRPFLLLLSAQLAARAIKGAAPAEGLTPILAPTKGHMQGVVGDNWTFQLNLSTAELLDFLPLGSEQLSPALEQELRNETLASFRRLGTEDRQQRAMLDGGYYSSGKGFQKVGMVCLLLHRFFGAADVRTKECTGWLAAGFSCFYGPDTQIRPGYFIRSKLSGKCLDVDGSPGVADGAIIQLGGCEFAHNTDQLWEVSADGFIKNTLSGKCVDVAGNPTASNEARLILQECDPTNPHSAQKWELTATGLLQSRLSGKCIASEANKAALHLRDCDLKDGISGLQWELRANEGCRGASKSYYDEDWGGIPSREGWIRGNCDTDYGNSCYNDHHYHFGYFVVSAAILAKLDPSMLEQAPFVDYVNTLIRDTANPSVEDEQFPPFRAFDWFDLHSWSHGISPVRDGKDQESTSEELNLLYGLLLWGRVTGNARLEQLGATMLTLAAHTVREIFLMKDGNQFHPAEFVKNRVTGIFFQNKVDYTTWFGSAPELVHGIQMLPLSPALEMTRRRDFCQQEWDDILSHIGLRSYFTNAWASIVFTGNLAVIKPALAFGLLKNITEEEMDTGLSRAWALFWAAAKPGSAEVLNAAVAAGTPTQRNTSESLLVPVGVQTRPNASVFPAKRGHPMYKPEHTEVTGPKATNKFWANWVVATGPDYPIYPMPYVLSWGGATKLHIATCSSHLYFYGSGGRMKAYVSLSETEFTMGAKEPTSNYTVVSEGLFGFHAEVRGLFGQKITFPIYSGMAYVSGRFSGGLTPVISHPDGLDRVQKVRDGIWAFRNNKGNESRVYVLDAAGNFVDSAYDFDAKGQLNQALDGWVRLAQVLGASDEQILDAHAKAILVGFRLQVEAGGTVRYVFQKDRASDLELLHWGFGHQLQLLVQESQSVHRPLLL